MHLLLYLVISRSVVKSYIDVVEIKIKILLDPRIPFYETNTIKKSLEVCKEHITELGLDLGVIHELNEMNLLYLFLKQVEPVSCNFMLLLGF